ncbi:MAG: FAD:protein FMN transferase, partial [Candidatus Omnitrophota bacterium]
MKKIVVIYIVICCFVLVGAALLNGVVKSEKRFLLGTIVEITARAPFWHNFNRTFSRVFAEVERVELVANRYNSHSEVSEVNLSASEYPFSVSDDLLYLIQSSLDISEKTLGTFDITIAPLVSLWKEARSKNLIPSSSDIEKIKKTVGFDKIVLNKQAQTVFFKNKNIEIDLSAIAKGYAVDRAVSVLQKFGIRSALVNAGGEIYCLGKRNLLMRWRVGIADPHKEKPHTKILFLKNQAVATSGGYEQYYTYEGKKCSHII